MAKAHLKIASLDVDVDLVTDTTVTLGEAGAIERVLGTPFSKLDKSSVETLTAFFWVSARRKNMALTIDDIRGISFSELELTGVDGEAVDPSQLAAPASEEGGDPTTSRPENSGTPSA